MYMFIENILNGIVFVGARCIVPLHKFCRSNRFSINRGDALPVIRPHPFDWRPHRVAPTVLESSPFDGDSKQDRLAGSRITTGCDVNQVQAQFQPGA